MRLARRVVHWVAVLALGSTPSASALAQADPATAGSTPPSVAGANSATEQTPPADTSQPQRSPPPPGDSQEAAGLPGSKLQPVGESARPVNRRPFGPGTEVEVSTPHPRQVIVYVGRAVDLRYRPPDHEFVKIGRTPLTFELPPNENFWLEVESPEVTRGGLLLRMGSEPKHLLVRTGSADMADLGSLSLAIGGLAVAVATVILVSGASGESRIDKPAIVIPLYAAGGALVAGGIALYFASRTDVEDPADKTAFRALERPRSGALPEAVITGIQLRF